MSWLYYSDRLAEFPVGILGVALATAILPKLARDHVAEDEDSFSKSLGWGVKFTLLIGLALMAEPILSTLFKSEQFSDSDVHKAGQSLMAYAAGLVGFMGIKVLAPEFSSRKDLVTPVWRGLRQWRLLRTQGFCWSN